MSHTDHARPARRPEHSDRTSRHLTRRTRRQSTRRQAVLATLRSER